MNASRLAFWIVGAAVSGAWLASAAGITRQARTARTVPVPPEVVQFDALAAEVQAQAGRLRERLASAPAPRAADRNPFAFRPVRAPRNHPDVARAQAEPLAVATMPPPEPVEPALELIGIAESNGPAGIVRTAMIRGPYDDLIMVTAGSRILSRYDVTAVGADAVELKDAQTGALRRLVLQ